MHSGRFVALGFLVHDHADAGVDAHVAGEWGTAEGSEIGGWEGEGQSEEGEEEEGEEEGFHGECVGFGVSGDVVWFILAVGKCLNVRKKI